MGSLVSSRGVGQYVASETHRIIHGRLSNPTDRAVIWCPGSHALADQFTFDPTTATVLQSLADARFRIISGDISQTLTQGTFGNDTAVTRVGQLRTFMLGTYGAAQSKVYLFGGSGGATAAINYARANPTLVAALALVCPLLDLQDFYDNRTDATLTKAEVDTAYGASFAAQVASHNPLGTGNQAALANVPIKIWYSTNDPYISPATVTAYQTKIIQAGGKCDLVSLGAVGHSAQGIKGDDVRDFFLANP